MSMLSLLAFTVLSVQPSVCIDPGHISEVGPGTRGLRVTELDVAWEVGKALEERLKKEGVRVVMTKDRVDQLVLNRDRSAIANNARVDLMVRLHCDAASGSGFAVYYPTQQGTSGEKVGPSQDILRRTAPIAKRFHAAMADSLRGKLNDNGLRSDLQTNVGSKQGALTGSIYSEVPVLLVEMVVLTNPQDEAFIISKSGREAMIDALAKGTLAAVKAK
jgi:N-acetylmuramoyl-L-alanine amidase